MMQPKHYFVVGNAVQHSLSPLIHQLFAKQTNKTICYQPYNIVNTSFKHAIDQLRTQSVCGVNVTMPFKLDAFNYATQHTTRANIAQSVNTLCFDQTGTVLGDNTDGTGLVSDLTNNLHWPINNERILIIGAGGAVRGIIPSLLTEKPAALYLANRTYSRAQAIAKQFALLGNITVLDFSQIKDYLTDIDLLIYAIAHDTPALPDFLTTDQQLTNMVCYDLNYATTPTPFIQWAKQQQAQAAVDGLGMLVEQAALTFNRWHDVTVDTQPVLRQLRDQIN